MNTALTADSDRIEHGYCAQPDCSQQPARRRWPSRFAARMDLGPSRLTGARLWVILDLKLDHHRCLGTGLRAVHPCVVWGGVGPGPKDCVHPSAHNPPSALRQKGS
jgi:hypothetical protein